MYTITATVRDALGNTTTRQTQVEIVVPATPGEIAAGVALLLVLVAIPVVAVVIAWRQRERIKSWRARRAAAAQQRAAESTYQRQLAAYQAALTAHQADDAAWQHSERRLASLVRTAETFQPTSDAAGLIQLKKGETCYGMFNATLIEERVRQGTPTLVDAAPGTVVITSHRMSLVAHKTRAWQFSKLQNVQSAGGGLTLMSVSNRKSASGVRVAVSDVERFRLHLDLALADATASRAVVIAQHQQQLARHHKNRPTSPIPPQHPQPVDPAAG